MILDKELSISAAQSITGATGAIAGTNIIDLQKTNLQTRADAKLICVINTACDSTGEAATLIVKIITDDAEAMDSATTLYTSATLAEATVAVAGYKVFEFPLSVFDGKLERYLSATYTVGTEALLTGKVDTYVTLDYQSV